MIGRVQDVDPEWIIDFHRQGSYGVDYESEFDIEEVLPDAENDDDDDKEEAREGNPLDLVHFHTTFYAHTNVDSNTPNTVYVYVHSMGTRTISLSDEAYKRLKAAKKEGESFSDVVNRISPGVRLEDYWGILDDEAAEELREAVADGRDRRHGTALCVVIGSLPSSRATGRTPSSDSRYGVPH
ncbi:antitoxin VapB family protein [Halalkalicoccus salilacus]|uniref:antitoxin VapB family protein n=1 Tax=Halalkalicoccus TaxID=332246 RepID=UPI002F9681BF